MFSGSFDKMYSTSSRAWQVMMDMFINGKFVDVDSLFTFDIKFKLVDLLGRETNVRSRGSEKPHSSFPCSTTPGDQLIANIKRTNFGFSESSDFRILIRS